VQSARRCKAQESQSHTKDSPVKKVSVVDEVVNRKAFGNKNLFCANWDDCMGAIAPANKRYEAALGKIGGSRRDLGSALTQYATEVDGKKLAAEPDVDPDEVQRVLLTKRFQSSWDPSGESDLNLAVSDQVTIHDSLRTCRVDADCVKVETLCSTCCGVDAIEKTQLNAFGELYAAACANYHGGVCDCAVAPGKPKCESRRCRRVLDATKR